MFVDNYYKERSLCLLLFFFVGFCGIICEYEQYSYFLWEGVPCCIR